MTARHVMRAFTAAGLALLMGAASSAQDSIQEKGRSILEANKSAVITVELVVNIQSSFPGFGSQQDERKMEATGVIVDPSGVAVLSLNSTDPTALMKRMGLADMMEGGSFESRLSSATYILESGDEVEADLVLRDPDLDLAFFRPSEAREEPFPFVDFGNEGSAQILDRVLVVNRLGRVTNRAYSISIEWIESLMERPRKFYIPGKQDTRSDLGCPAFTEDGKVLGLLSIRAIRTSGGGGMFGGSDQGVTSVILPASDVAELVPQAKEAEAEPMEESPPSEGEEGGEGEGEEPAVEGGPADI